MSILTTCLLIAGITLFMLGLLVIRDCERSVPAASLLVILNKTWRIERMVYRHHRASGIAIIVGSLVWLLFLEMSAPTVQVNPALRVVGTVAYCFALLTFLIGLFVTVRPSKLKRLEMLANTWVGPDNIHPPCSDELKRNLPVGGRTFGWMSVVAGTLFMLVAGIHISG